MSIHLLFIHFYHQFWIIQYAWILAKFVKCDQRIFKFLYSRKFCTKKGTEFLNGRGFHNGDLTKCESIGGKMKKEPERGQEARQGGQETGKEYRRG